MYHSSCTRRFVVAAISCFALVFSSQYSAVSAKLLAFPGAEGFGKYTSGGRGGKVVYVTTLEDDANGTIEGSLRWAMQQYPDEPITVCFAVTGEIRLVKDLRLNRRSNFTWAGQTAPGQGVVITHNKVNFGGSENFIVRNIRFRVGNEDAAGNFLNANAVGAENCANFIFDHCDFGWSSEENMNSFDSHFFTIQYCIVHEGLYNAGNPKGKRGYGCQWGGSPATYHHNLLTNNLKRSCRFNGARNNDNVVYIDYINNVVYNYEGGSNGCYGGECNSNIQEYNGLNAAHEVNFINNYYKPTANTKNERYFFQSDAARDGATSWTPSQWYVSGNIMEGSDAITNDNWQGVKVLRYSKFQVRVDTLIRPRLNYYNWVSEDSVQGRYDFEALAYAAGEFETAPEAFERVLDTVGAFPRDAVELRLIDEARNGTLTYTGSKEGKQGWIDSPNDAEGFFEYPQAEPVLDSDQDGMSDEWEVMMGLNPNEPDNNRQFGEGYTVLEGYLHYLMTGEMMPGEVWAEGIDDIKPERKTYKKILRNGELIIVREGKEYTVIGASR